MHSTFRMLTYLTLTVVFCATTGPNSLASEQNSGTPSASASTHHHLQYTLPPDKLQRSYALYRLNWTLYLVTTAWSFLVLYLMLRTRFLVRVRDLAERASRFRVVQALIVMPLFVLIFALAQLPFDSYEHHVSLQYGLSVQPWGSWFGDRGKMLLLVCLVAIVAGWGLYSSLRRSRRWWWLYFWLGTVPIVIFVLFVEPIWVDPMFNKFEPLTDRHAELVTQIGRVVQRAGMNIPPQRMFEMKASEKTTELNAYVTGFGATKRVVVWDTTMEHMSTPQTLFVFGHEMGHYVLGHIPKELTIILLLLLVLFYLGFRVANWMAALYGPRWGIHDLSDWASLPLLALILAVLTFLATPVFSAVSRHYEHQADQYGLEVIHGLVPDPSPAAAEAFQILGERSLDYPYVGKLAELWAWDHPTIRDRMIYVQTYDPWGDGRQPEFVENSP